MKKLLPLLLLVFLLSGCGIPLPKETEPETILTQPTAESTVTWLEEFSAPWDRNGVLVELPIHISDGLHFGSIMEFDGDLLFWGVDDHLADTVVLELCVLDLDTGEVNARKEIALSEYAYPQILGDTLYLSEPSTGRILALEKNLDVLHTWNIDPIPGAWYMGVKERLYVFADYSELYLYDLVTNATYPVLEDDPYIDYVTTEGSNLIIHYYGVDTGAKSFAILDLMTGQMHEAPVGDPFTTVSYLSSDWLCGYYTEHNVYHLSLDGAQARRIVVENGALQLLDGNYILKTTDDSTMLTLYDLHGNAVSQCCISECEYGLSCVSPIWSDNYQGYFLPVTDYSGNSRLLFWDISRRISAEPLVLESIPEPSEQEQQILERTQALSEKYGVVILTGNQCDTVFDEFTATTVTDFQRIVDALDTLDQALSVYPEGFFRQLRHGDVHSIQIQLISDLQADGSGRYGGGYSAFTQYQWDHYLIVIDIDASSAQTYYHEFSHVIDSYLQWDSENREGALFSEETWNSLNPSWFDGYSYDYGYEVYLDEYTYFVDSYATISPTEDRARVLEYAMADWGQWTFEDAKGLQKKLSYYCRCIRDAFDTSGWPETLLWEQYLS